MEQRDREQASKKKKKKRNDFLNKPIKYLHQFALCDAMRYIRAIEVGQDPRSVKYDIAVRLRTLKNSAAIRSNVQLPYVVNSTVRVCVICPPGSDIALQARQAGAVLVGEDEIFNAVKEGVIEFDRCICHESSAQKLNEAGLAKILGPKGLMPNARRGTITNDITRTMKELAGSTQYRERYAVVRCSIGQLGFSPEQMQANVRVFMAKVKQDIVNISDKVNKDIHEVVLSSTHSPGFTLNGEFQSLDGVSTKDLGVV